jgi:hypothetical protein
MTVRIGVVDFPSNLAKARYMAEAGAADVWQHEVQRGRGRFSSSQRTRCKTTRSP